MEDGLLINQSKFLRDSANNVGSFLGRRFAGETTNVSAIVERTERYAVGALDITELFLSGFDANNAYIRADAKTQDYTTFLLGEAITTETADANGNYATATTSGLLQGVDIVFGGSGYTKEKNYKLLVGVVQEPKLKLVQ